MLAVPICILYVALKLCNSKCVSETISQMIYIERSYQRIATRLTLIDKPNDLLLFGMLLNCSSSDITHRFLELNSSFFTAIRIDWKMLHHFRQNFNQIEPESRSNRMLATRKITTSLFRSKHNREYHDMYCHLSQKQSAWQFSWWTSFSARAIIQHSALFWHTKCICGICLCQNSR